MAPTSPTGGARSVAVPADWANLIGRVSGFEPESDTALLRFMASECRGGVGYAQAMHHLHMTCLSGIGLDPASIRGLSDYADAAAELGRAMTRAHATFLAVYQEVMEATGRGVILPYNGRWFETGGAA